MKTGGGREEQCCKLVRVFGKFRLEILGSHKSDAKGDTKNDMQMEGRKMGQSLWRSLGLERKKLRISEQKQILNQF